MGYDDADLEGIALPHAVCWELLKYEIVAAVDIPCRFEVAGRRVRTPFVRARLRILASDDAGYMHTVQMYLHRGVSLGPFGPRFRIYCQADRADHTLLHLRADSDAAFESRGLTRVLAWGYGLQWRLLSRIAEDAAKESLQTLHGAKVFFEDVEAYTFGQLTETGLNEGFHRRGYAYIAELLREQLRAMVR